VAAPNASTAGPAIAKRDAKPWLAALGGRDNVIEAGAASSRLWLRLRDPAKLDAAALAALGTKAIATPAEGIVHLIVGADAEPLAASLLQ
jgi:PTS system N-acetylglucosamine-specific IIC component